jgi:glutathione synthase/RimK-type ligase-like ATP-grasp enzyme
MAPLVGVATSSDLPESDVSGRLLVSALERHGARSHVVEWSADRDWQTYDAIIIQTCWDYHLRAPVFISWANRLEGIGTVVLNSSALLRWNYHKQYLLSLRDANIPVVPSALVRRGGDFREAVREFETLDLVAKPAVSASAMHTYRVDARTAQGAAAIDTLSRDGDVIIQPYMEAIAGGETSFVFFAGAFSHAVLKRPRQGDFRVQSEHGGTVEVVIPTQDAIDAAARVLTAVPEAPVYARVDGLVQGDRVLLMEVELIEPELFLFAVPDAADRFAACALAAVAGRVR